MGRKTTYPVLLAGLMLLLAFCISSAVSQPTPNNVTGHMGGVSGTPVAGTYIQFQLTNCAGNSPRILGYTGIAPFTGAFLPDDTGLITGTIWANDQIDCGGVTGNTRWMVTNVVNNIPQGLPTCYQVLSTSNPFNLDTASPAIPCITSTPILPNDLNAHNLTLTGGLFGVNAVFGGTVQAHKFLLDFTPSPCGSGLFMTGYNADFTPICSALPSGVVTSVFGRAGAVVPVSGDYDCGQVTGCPTGAITSLTGMVIAHGPGAATATLATVGSGGSCTNCNAIYDVYGRATTYSNGTTSPFGTAQHIHWSAGTNITSDRAYNTEYQNTSANPLLFTLSSNTGAGPAAGTSTIENSVTSGAEVEVSVASCIAVSSGIVSCSQTAIIPAGNFYKVTMSGTQFIQDWVEWTNP